LQVESDDEGRVPSNFLYGVGAFMIIVGLVLASVFIFRLQPPLAVSVPQQTSTAVGTTSITMPNGVGTNTALNFSPADVTVVIGVNNTVVWTNQDISGHTVVTRQVPAGAANFSSSILTKGAKFNVTLTVPGTYLYFCSLHPAWMQGKIVVKAGSGPSPGVTVTIPAGVGSSTSLNYAPPSITVVIGVNNTVTWVNKDQSIHTVTATDKSFDSGNILTGGSFTLKFTTPGTYSYVCIYHSWMKGTVVVKPAS
jgi:plastocyanin